MEKLEIIVRADELKPGDVIRRDLNTRHPEERMQTVISVEPVGLNGVSVEFESPEKCKWKNYYQCNQRLVLVHRPYSDGGKAETMTRIDNSLSDVLEKLVVIKRPEFLPRLRKAIEALELSQPLETKK